MHSTYQNFGDGFQHFGLGAKTGINHPGSGAVVTEAVEGGGKGGASRIAGLSRAAPSSAPPLWNPWNLLLNLHRLNFLDEPNSSNKLECRSALNPLRTQGALTLLRPPKMGSGLSHLCFGIHAVPAALVERENSWICPALPQMNCSALGAGAPCCNPS